ncbi:MAG: SDR family oxidoreductase [Hyphomicrobiales bacterium]|nr:MAG: SDR family oxidoreductase [Hyphomicrobiales bacterium]
MSMRFAGKVVLVTGAAGGIGAATVRALVAEGALAIASDLKRPARDLGIEDVRFIEAEVSDRSSVDNLVAAAEAVAGHIDALVHTAAILGASGPFEQLSSDDWSRYLDINLTGTFNTCQSVARSMIRTGTRGRIVTMGSVNAFAAEPEAAPYVASKGGIRLLTKAMAVDLARHGIAANMVAPGPIHVPRNTELFAQPELVALFAQSVPYGSAGSAEDVARAAVFLADPNLAFVTGAELAVDGGTMAQVLALPKAAG